MNPTIHNSKTTTATVEIGRRPRRESLGFTLIELLVVVAVIGLLAMMLLPALSSARPDARAAGCLANERRLIQAWRMYAEDNSDILAPNDYPYHTSYSTATSTQKAQMFNWVAGTMWNQFDAASTLGIGILTNPAATALAYYVKNPNVYHCPADQFLNPNAGGKMNVRSYSMNSAVGTIWWGYWNGSGLPLGAPVTGGWLPGSSYIPNQGAWRTYGKMSSFTQPGPANAFIIVDENTYSINDASIAIPAFATPGNTYLIDYLSGNHSGAASMSFADGHVVMHKWQDVRTCTPQVAPGNGGSPSAPAVHALPDDVDCLYLASITSAPR
jgi:prepilin-type N-terminal cleavage/methylation domain-containing protein/prepilin-type processing-associated H-X9-DG protein